MRSARREGEGPCCVIPLDQVLDAVEIRVLWVVVVRVTLELESEVLIVALELERSSTDDVLGTKLGILGLPDVPWGYACPPHGKNGKEVGRWIAQVDHQSLGVACLDRSHHYEPVDLRMVELV